MTTPSQNKLILSFLQKGNSLTPKEALKEFGCMRLASRIHDLKQEGHPIQSQRIKTPSGAYVSEYWMAG